jgi:TetR/AcrR family transcriptional regulator
MARPRAASYEDQRTHILRAAAGLFASRGYPTATMAEVALASGVSKATLYHYFCDKYQLLFEIATDHVRKLERLVGEVVVQDAPPDQRLSALILQFMRAYADATDAHRVLTEDVKFLPLEDRQAVEDAQRRVVRAFADAVAQVRPDLAPGLHKPLAMLLFGMMNWTFTWLRPEGALSHESLAPWVVQLFAGGLASLPEARVSAPAPPDRA